MQHLKHFKLLHLKHFKLLHLKHFKMLHLKLLWKILLSVEPGPKHVICTCELRYGELSVTLLIAVMSLQVTLLRRLSYVTQTRELRYSGAHELRYSDV